MVVDHTNPNYIKRWDRLGAGRFNGAYYYSREIINIIKPRVKTDRSWITVNLKGQACDHAIVFIHNNLNPAHYEWLKEYNDLVLVCGVKETCDKVKHIGKPIYLPLSVDVAEVEQHKKEKRSGEAFAGRPAKRGMKGIKIPNGAAVIEGMERSQFLEKMSRYQTIYAVGRTAIEAKVLGCDIGVYDSRYKDPDVWQILDNADAAKILQAELDKIDNATADMKWTKAELLAYCKDKGIDIDERANKKEIIEAING